MPKDLSSFQKPVFLKTTYPIVFISKSLVFLGSQSIFFRVPLGRTRRPFFPVFLGGALSSLAAEFSRRRWGVSAEALDVQKPYGANKDPLGA